MRGYHDCLKRKNHNRDRDIVTNNVGHLAQRCESHDSHLLKRLFLLSLLFYLTTFPTRRNVLCADERPVLGSDVMIFVALQVLNIASLPLHRLDLLDSNTLAKWKVPGSMFL